MGVVDEGIRQQEISQSQLLGKYECAIDRESAYEILQKKYEAEQAATEKAAQEKQAEREAAAIRKAEREALRDAATAERIKKNNRTALEKYVSSTLSTAGRQATRTVTNTLVRGIMGSLTRK